MTPYLSGWLAAREEAARVAEQAAESASREDCGNDHGEGIASTIRALKPPEPEPHGEKCDCLPCKMERIWAPTAAENPAPEGFEEWHGACKCGGARLVDDWRMPAHLRGRTCREVWSEEQKKVPGASRTPTTPVESEPAGNSDTRSRARVTPPTGTNPPKRYIGALAGTVGLDGDTRRECPNCRADMELQQVCENCGHREPRPSCAGGDELLGAAGRAMSGAANAIAICRGSTGGVLPSVDLIDSLRGLVTRIDKHLGRAGRGEA